MDASGANTLRQWFEQQEHWRLAPAVTNGEQPQTDPDVWELEEFGDDLRLYRVREEERRTIDGQPSLVIRRLTKRLVDGRWETLYEIERVRPL
jgi:hypothetical protein